MLTHRGMHAMNGNTTVRKGNRTLVANDKRKSGGKKRRNRKGGRKGGRVGVYAAAGNQLYRDVKWLMAMVNVEDKYIDTSGSPAMANAWTYVLLNPISQGTTPVTRVGQSVKCVGLELRANVFVSAASTAIGQTVRIMLFIDKQPNAAAPGAADIYPAGSLTPRVVGYIDRFGIMFERTYALNNVNNTIFTFDYIARQSWHEEFNTGNAGTIADITKNALYLGYYTDQSANFPTISYNARYVYVDN
jgi:hypothetical protein